MSSRWSSARRPTPAATTRLDGTPATLCGSPAHHPEFQGIPVLSVEKNLASGTWYFCCKMLWSAGFPPTRPFQFSLGHDSLFMLLIMVSEALRVSRFAMRALHQKIWIAGHVNIISCVPGRNSIPSLCAKEIQILLHPLFFVLRFLFSPTIFREMHCWLFLFRNSSRPVCLCLLASRWLVTSSWLMLRDPWQAWVVLPDE